MFPPLALARFRKLGRVLAHLLAPALLAITLPAQRVSHPIFAEVIRTPAGLQAALERCDGDPAFETAFANWLESAHAASRGEREAIRRASLRLLEDTTDHQLVLGLIDGLLRHAVEDLESDGATPPVRVARILYADVGKARKNRKSKPSDIALLAENLLSEGAVTMERQTSFLQEVVNLAESRQVTRSLPSHAKTITPPQIPAAETAISSEHSLRLRP